MELGRNDGDRFYDIFGNPQGADDPLEVYSPTATGAGQARENTQDDELSEDGSEDFALPAPTTLTAMKETLITSRFTKFLEQFDEDVARGTDTVVFASLPAAVINEGQQTQVMSQGINAEDERLQHQNDVDHVELLRKRRLFEMNRKRQEQIAHQRQQIRELTVKSALTGELLDTFFEITHQELDIHLTSRSSEVMQSVGELRKFDRGAYDPDVPDWSLMEQQVEIHVAQIRGVRNKIPQGEYILLISKWDMLGGAPMRWSIKSVGLLQSAPCPIHVSSKSKRRWSCEVCQGWAGSTMPIAHKGDQKSYDMQFDARAFTFFPSQSRVKPYMALLFELVLLPKKRRGDPRVVGWGAFPCVDANFAVINGKFRLPILRGEYSPHFRHHETIKEAISDDIENWLGNLYVDIFPHPREYFGRREFTIQQEFTSKLLNLDKYPSTKESDGWPVDARKRGNSFDMLNDPNKPTEAMVDPFTGAKLPGIGVATPAHAQVGDGAAADHHQRASTFAPGGSEDINFFPYVRPAKVKDFETLTLTRWGIIRDAVNDRAKSKIQEEQRIQREAVKRAEEQKKYRFSIHPHGAVLLHSTWDIQIEYCRRAILDELSLRDPLHFKFWLNIGFCLISLIFQFYFRDAFRLAAFIAIGVPIDKINISIFGLEIIASVRNTTAFQELFICFFGVLASTMLVLLLVITGFLLRATSGFVPEQLSKFVFGMSWNFYFVPWIYIILDLARGTKQSDIARLSDFFILARYGVSFAFLTFFLVYLLLSTWTFVITFLYTMRIHLNGIMHDSYWRILEVNEDNFFIPNDLELSQKELYWALQKAEAWRGCNGHRRKTGVYDLITTDDNDPEYEQKNQYIVIEQLDCDDSALYLEYRPMKIFRQFYVTWEGAIIEALAADMPAGVTQAVVTMGKQLLSLAKHGEGGALGLAIKNNVENLPDEKARKHSTKGHVAFDDSFLGK
jgi:hypothetical protein